MINLDVEGLRTNDNASVFKKLVKICKENALGSELEEHVMTFLDCSLTFYRRHNIGNIEIVESVRFTLGTRWGVPFSDDESEVDEDDFSMTSSVQDEVVQSEQAEIGTDPQHLSVEELDQQLADILVPIRPISSPPIQAVVPPPGGPSVQPPPAPTCPPTTSGPALPIGYVIPRNKTAYRAYA